MDVLLLVGGKGTRLSSVSNGIPKPLIDFNNKPFLYHLIKYLSSFGLTRFILCTGYKNKLFKSFSEGYRFIQSYSKRPKEETIFLEL